MTDSIQATAEGMTNHQRILAGREEFKIFLSDPTQCYPDRVCGGTTGDLAADTLVLQTLISAKYHEDPITHVQNVARYLMFLPERDSRRRRALLRLCDLLAPDEDFEDCDLNG